MTACLHFLPSPQKWGSNSDQLYVTVKPWRSRARCCTDMLLIYHFSGLFQRPPDDVCVTMTVFPIISAYYFSISQEFEGLTVQTDPEPSDPWVYTADGCPEATNNCNVLLSLTFISTGTPQNWDTWLFLKWRSQNCFTHFSSLNCSCFYDWVWMQHRFTIPVFVVPSCWMFTDLPGQLLLHLHWNLKGCRDHFREAAGPVCLEGWAIILRD